MHKFLFILLLFLLTTLKLGAEEVMIVDIEKAKVYASEKKHLQALKMLVPCLKDDVKIENDSLEECLYWGGVIFKQAFSLENNHINEPLLGEFQKLGLDVNFWKWAPSIDSNNFFKKMNKYFSHSKYEDILAFENIPWAYNELAPVLKTAKAFERYRQNYPKGRHYAEATLNLAHIYDNLWEDIREPLEGDGYHECYMCSVDSIQDTKDAEDYRNKALHFYEEYFKYSMKDVEKERVRYEELKNRKPSNVFYILND